MVALTTIATMDPDNDWKHNVTTLPISVVEEQLKTILAGDTKIAAMKTSMLGSVEIVELVDNTISAYHFPKVVIDPVLACKGEDELLNPETAEAIQKYLLPLADVATPNLIEAGIFSGLGKLTTLETKKIHPAYNHGAGCTFAAAITAGLATGLSEKEAIFKAKDFVTAAIEHGFRFNEFVGPIFHGAYRLKDSETI
ncbi:pyridoxine kinase [Carnobacterium sp. 17-4]|nr:pyridoxine kinase [Carnobacterium sp. 17-4]